MLTAPSVVPDSSLQLNLARFYNSPLQWLILARLSLVLDKVLVDILNMLIQYVSQHIQNIKLKDKNRPQRRLFPHSKYCSGKYWPCVIWNHGQAKKLLAVWFFEDLKTSIISLHSKDKPGSWTITEWKKRLQHDSYSCGVLGNIYRCKSNE